ncbi:MAG: hypothetical protein K2X29_10290 [Candidatus Obscuribacterales bacterium]|nr:hypothetical protein [Candidatus Obscuribacterales bacterium]
MSNSILSSRYTYLGVSLIALSTLMYEILLTRIFSVILWYHFAFMVVSTAMFGMTVGALYVYLFPQRFEQKSTSFYLVQNGLLMSVSCLLSFLAFLPVSYLPPSDLTSIFALAYTYILFSIPFFFSGITICLALTRFPKQIGQIYAADLCGAALGCLAVIGLLNLFDGPTVVIITAALASMAALAFSIDQSKKLKYASLASVIGLCLLSAAHSAAVQMHLPSISLHNIRRSDKALYERWNAFSCVRLLPNRLDPTSCFGLGSTDKQTSTVESLDLVIDTSAATTLTKYNGDLDSIKYLQNDITNIVHHLRKNADVVVIGVGGGRDVLSALSFRQPSILGIEINNIILDILQNTYADYSGHLGKAPGVTLVLDEARSHIERSNRKFDIIQASLIDTWAATSAGAFTLTENAIYTLDAWKLLLRHTTDNGIISFSRWYRQNGTPDEIYRICALAEAALREDGIKEPRNNVIIMADLYPGTKRGVATILVSKKPFSQQDIASAEELSKRFNFILVLTPNSTIDPNIAKILSESSNQSFIQNFPLNIAPPTDDSPFFFNMLRLKDSFNTNLLSDEPGESTSRAAVGTLGRLMATSLLLTALFIFLPLYATRKQINIRKSIGLLAYFASIGCGFMLIEIAMMQKLTIFLGHPTSGLSVVLFVLLISGGIGSYITKNISDDVFRSRSLLRLVATVIVLLVALCGTNVLNDYFQATSIPLRLLISTAFLFPMGLLMGMAFPLGMRLATKNSPNITQWLWGINGATSVCASVLAVVISISFGINAAFITGILFYVLALIAFFGSSRS